MDNFSHVDWDTFSVPYHHNFVEREIVSLHRLRPLPPPEMHRKFNSGDELDGFRNDREWINPSNRDRISEIPDGVLLHIMNFVDTKDAIRTTFLLSKRWKNLCKLLTNPTFSPNPKHRRKRHEEFQKIGVLGSLHPRRLLFPAQSQHSPSRLLCCLWKLKRGSLNMHLSFDPYSLTLYAHTVT